MFSPFQIKLLSIYQIGDLEVGAEEIIAQKMEEEDLRIIELNKKES